MEEIIKLTKDSDSLTIRKYFEKILELNKEEKQFPVDLDDVWMLVYSRKDPAIRDLKEKFIENIDYVINSSISIKASYINSQSTDNQIFHKNVENQEYNDKYEQNNTKEVEMVLPKCKPGRPTNKYYLTVSCLEYFIARKVRNVFDVYRQVFHRVAEGEKTHTRKHTLTAEEKLRVSTGSTDEEIIAYLEEIKQAHNSGDKFPVAVNDVWGLRFKAKRRVTDRLFGTNGMPMLYREGKDYSVNIPIKRGFRNGRNTRCCYMSLKTFFDILIAEDTHMQELYNKVFRCETKPAHTERKPVLPVTGAENIRRKALLADALLGALEVSKKNKNPEIDKVIDNLIEIGKTL